MMIADSDDLEDDDVFSSEIGAADEEISAMGAEEVMPVEAEPSPAPAEINDVNEVENTEDDKMSDSNVDDMLADIMGEEKARVDSASGVGIEAEEAVCFANNEVGEVFRNWLQETQGLKLY